MLIKPTKLYRKGRQSPKALRWVFKLVGVW